MPLKQPINGQFERFVDTLCLSQSHTVKSILFVMFHKRDCHCLHIQVITITSPYGGYAIPRKGTLGFDLWFMCWLHHWSKLLFNTFIFYLGGKWYHFSRAFPFGSFTHFRLSTRSHKSDLAVGFMGPRGVLTHSRWVSLSVGLFAVPCANEQNSRPEVLSIFAKKTKT